MENQRYSIEHDKNTFNIILADMLMDDILNQVGIIILEEEENLNEEMHDLIANRNLSHVLSLLGMHEVAHEAITSEYNDKVANLSEYPESIDFNEAVNVNCIEFVKHLMDWNKGDNFPVYTPVYNARDLDFEINLN